MRNTHSSRLAALVGSSLLFGCASVPLGQTVEQRAPELPIYTTGELNPGRYEVVTRQWGDTWRSAFWSPTFPTREQAVAALNAEAAARGADGLLNVYCLEQGHWHWSQSTEPAILCYGIGIRLRPG